MNSTYKLLCTYTVNTFYDDDDFMPKRATSVLQLDQGHYLPFGGLALMPLGHCQPSG